MLFFLLILHNNGNYYEELTEKITPNTNYTPVKRPERKMKRVNTIDYYVKLFQVKTAIVNCKNLGIKLLRILFVHIRNVDKTDMHVTKI